MAKQPPSPASPSGGTPLRKAVPPPPAEKPSSGFVQREVGVGDRARRRKDREGSESGKAEESMPQDRSGESDLDLDASSPERLSPGELSEGPKSRVVLPDTPEVRPSSESPAVSLSRERSAPVSERQDGLRASSVGQLTASITAASASADSDVLLRRNRGQEVEGEEAWTGVQSVTLWWVLAGGVCFVVVGIFLLQTFKSSGVGGAIEAPERIKVVDDFSGDSLAEIVARSDEILPEISELLDLVLVTDQEGFSKYIRGGEESLERRAEWLARNPKVARHYPRTRRELHAAVAAETGYLILLGLDAEYLSSVAYLVNNGNIIKYDWEASEGYSELLPYEVDRLSDHDAKLMRVVSVPSVFYPPSFPEEEFQAYALHHQDPGEFVWAFARRDSVANQSMVASFQSPDLKGTENRVTIRVRKGPEGARANELEIVEFLHADWLTPDLLLDR